MSSQSKISGDLFQNDTEKNKRGSSDNCASSISKYAGAAQKNARSNKKSSSAFRTISEVANDLSVQQHVLRFWETKFSQVKPLKRGGGRRYYRPEDIDLLQAIHTLLYVEGYTIKGVQKLLRDVGKKQIVASFSSGAADKDILKSEINKDQIAQDVPKMKSLDNSQREVLNAVLTELKDLRGMIKPRS